ncbi:50S ribosomal protein L5 [Patescibacteria group bacterium]|nr:50S ribosomal protein L5 [Patescibacteria group bacterium]
MINVKENYKKAIPILKEKFGYKNVMALPKIEKVVVNTGLGSLTVSKTGGESKKIFESVIQDLSIICGQKVVLTKARKSVAVYKTRAGMPIGAKVTLRGPKMNDFLNRVINIALPRSRDFQGINSNSFDQHGNLTIPIKEHIIFPEISAESSKIIFGFEITVVTTAKNKEEGLELLRLLGFPIKK